MISWLHPRSQNRDLGHPSSLSGSFHCLPAEGKSAPRVVSTVDGCRYDTFARLMEQELPHCRGVVRK